jgi:hypothetical protein
VQCADSTVKFSGTPCRSVAAVAGGGLARREERDLVARRARDLDRLRHAVDHVDRRAAGLRVGQRTRRPRHAHHVAVGRDANALVGQRHGFIDLGHVGDAHRAARPHDHVELLRQDGAQAEPRDRLLVAAAHVHHRDASRSISATCAR